MLLQKPKNLDVVLLTLFTIGITLHPFYLHGQINLFELGIYLPGIRAILDGAIPYRDFFYLRGPFELYMPAFLMRIFGQNAALLMFYFYAGSVITLISCVILARQLLTTRLFYYLAIPVLVARTFPRVVFTYWGGMRFALGLMAVACCVQYFRNERPRWVFFSGILAACSFWTSIEIGAYACMAVLATLTLCALAKILKTNDFIKAALLFGAGFLLIGLPYGLYLYLKGALIPYGQTLLTVVHNMEKTFPQSEVVPRNLMEGLLAMLNPGGKNFRHMTPAYLYLFLTIYFLMKAKRKEICFSDFSIICLALYGFLFFVGSFRNIWSSNFEMMLQPEKILLFLLLERICLFLAKRKEALLGAIKQQRSSVLKQRLKVYLISIFLGGVILSSVGYSIQRYNKRFFAFKFVRNLLLRKETASLKPLNGVEETKLEMQTLRGLTVPSWQAHDFIQLARFIGSRTSAGDAVLFYPEGAAYSFIIDRPFVGKFPMANFSWFSEDSHREYLKSLKDTQADFTVVPKILPPYFDKTHFVVKENKQKYDEAMQYIEQHYEFVAATPTLNILQRKESE